MEFSVLMSVYKNDKKDYFKKALDSIINQTVKPNEIILVIDGPIPSELNEIIEEYKSKYKNLKPIYLEKNVGLGNALKIGLEECSYNLVARMDSDDISVNNRFEKQLLEFKNDKDLSVVGSHIIEFIDTPKNCIGSKKVPLDDLEIYKYLKYRCPFNHSSVMFKKSEVLKCGRIY